MERKLHVIGKMEKIATRRLQNRRCFRTWRSIRALGDIIKVNGTKDWRIFQEVAHQKQPCSLCRAAELMACWMWSACSAVVPTVESNFWTLKPSIHYNYTQHNEINKNMKSRRESGSKLSQTLGWRIISTCCYCCSLWLSVLDGSRWRFAASLWADVSSTLRLKKNYTQFIERQAPVIKLMLLNGGTLPWINGAALVQLRGGK